MPNSARLGDVTDNTVCFGALQHATPRVMASALPRTIVFSSPRRRMVKPGATGSPHAILQQEATNSQTGKKAVGPW